MVTGGSARHRVAIARRAGPGAGRRSRGSALSRLAPDDPGIDDWQLQKGFCDAVSRTNGCKDLEKVALNNVRRAESGAPGVLHVGGVGLRSCLGTSSVIG